jgi:hypothetical protein
LGGCMKIKSAPGTGTRLLIALPYEPAARTQDAVEVGSGISPKISA